MTAESPRRVCIIGCFARERERRQMEGRDDGEEEAESHLKGCNDQKKIDAYQVLLHGVGESGKLKVAVLERYLCVF